jgi:hypothetical protein
MSVVVKHPCITAVFGVHDDRVHRLAGAWPGNIRNLHVPAAPPAAPRDGPADRGPLA